MDPLSLAQGVLALAQAVKTSFEAQAHNNATSCNLLRRLLCFEESVREIEVALQGVPTLALPSGKLQALSRLHGYVAEVKAVAGKLLRLSGGGIVSRAKGLWNAKQWKDDLEELAKNIDRCVADLTLAEVRQQGEAQLGAAEFHKLIMAQQEDLARQVTLLQRAGAAGSGSAALEAVVLELADELRMERNDVAKQLEAERFLLNQNLEQLSDLEARVLEALDAKALLGVDVARLGAVVGEQLAALDARSGANADAVAAAVALALERGGISTVGTQAAVREELVGFAQGIKSLEQAVLANQDRHAARLESDLASLKAGMEALLLEKRRLDQTEGVLEDKSSHNTFADLFEFAPKSAEEWVQIHGEDFADDDEEERALLGTGSFAYTYRVRAREGEGIRAGALFAAKVVELKTLTRMGLGKDAVLREAHALRELRHKHVVRFLGLFNDKKKFWIVMELAGGGSLAARLPPMASAAPALDDVRRWVRQLVEALEYIHARKVFHRDIKPENVLISEGGDAKLADFGLAVVQTSSMASAGGTKAGTEWYYSPEKANGKKASLGPVDMWAAGCVGVEVTAWVRLGGPLWSEDAEVRERRAGLVARASAVDPLLGAAAGALLHIAPGARPSARQVLAFLDPLEAMSVLAVNHLEAEEEGRRKEAEERSSREVEEERGRKEEELRRMEAEEKSSREAEEGRRKAAEEERNRKEAMERSRMEADERRRKVAEEDRMREEAEERSRKEAEQKKQAAPTEAREKIQAGAQPGEIVGLMKQHVGAVGVQEAGCEAFALKGTEYYSDKIATLGEIEAVLAGMGAHAGAEGVQAQGCRALESLCSNADNQVKAGSLGGVEVVLAGMSAHPGAVRVQENGCRALCNLCANTDNRIKTASLGGIEAVLLVMRAHPGVARIQQSGCYALCNFCSSQNTRVKVATLGGIEAVLDGMSAHIGVSIVQEVGCAVLYNLVDNAAVVEQMKALGRVRGVVERAKAAYPSNTNIQDRAKKVLEKLL